MAQQTINNGESGLVVRDKLNDNFTELYTAVAEDPYPQVNTHADLPAATGSGDIYVVLTTTGAIGFRKLAGLWYDSSVGPVWTYLGLYGRNAAEIVNVPAGTISSTDVQAAINELDGDLEAHKAAGGFQHPDAIPATSGFMSGADKTKLDTITGTNTGDQTSIVGITGSLAEFNTALTGADFASGGGTVTGASSGTNTGDQTSIVGITGTIAQFNTAVTDADLATGGGTATGTNTGDQTTITGNAGTATALQTSRDFSISGSGVTAATVGFTGAANVVLAASVDAGHITLARMADMATSSLIYRKTAGTGVPEVQTLATLKTDLGLTGTNSGDQTITLTGNVTGSGTGSFAATIANDAVTNAQLANVSTATFKGRITAASGDPEDLSGTQATTLLDTFTSGLKGLVPASGGGTTNFLRADGTFADPAVGPGSGISIGLASTLSIASYSM